MKRSHGSYSKHSRNLSAKPKETIRSHLAAFAVGDRVRLVANPNTKDGRPFLRFNGRIGVVAGKRGAAYHVTVNDGDKPKALVISSRHLVRLA